VPYTQIAYEVADGVATITLDRPDRLNAFTVTMQRELCAALDEVDADPGVRVVVVTGRGRGFCAGADLGGGEASFITTATWPPTPAWCWRTTDVTVTRAAWWRSGSSRAPSR
jgi:enoyl-CoA hydratase/carnithine racemase